MRVRVRASYKMTWRVPHTPGHGAANPVKYAVSHYADGSLSFNMTSCAPPSMMLVDDTSVNLAF
jgi:hypothetical protein